MTPTLAVRTCFARYATFTGRAGRSEYWWFVLFVVLAGCLTARVDAVLGGRAVTTVLFLATVVPSFAVSTRRLHDTGRSGWWVLLGVVPVVDVALLVFYVLAGQPARNAYGPSPGRP